MGKYDDIIDLPHHVSPTRPRMAMSDWAAQFMPFRALTGYEDTVRETARLTEERPQLTEEEKAVIDGKLQLLAEELADQPQVTLTFFRPDRKKAGGAYVTLTGQLKKVDDHGSALVLAGGERILLEDILDIQIIAP